jgi:hypothetical protein
MNPIIGYAVGQKATENAWGEFVNATAQALLGSDTPLQAFGEWCDSNEEAYKNEFEVRTLPTTYRSAKSVVKKALELGVPIMADGSFVPKSALEKLYKQAQATLEVADTTSEYKALGLLHRALDAYNKAGSAEQGVFLDRIRGFWEAHN